MGVQKHFFTIATPKSADLSTTFHRTYQTMSFPSHKADCCCGYDPERFSNEEPVRLFSRRAVTSYPFQLWKEVTVFFTKEEFQLLWAFLIYIARNPDGILYIQLSPDGCPVNAVTETGFLSDAISSETLGRIVHRSVWGVDGNLSPDLMTSPRFSHDFEKSLPYRQEVEADPKFWFDKIRDAYHAWVEAGGLVGDPSMPSEIKIYGPDGKLHPDPSSHRISAAPYRKPSDNLEPQYTHEVRGENSTYTLMGPLVPKSEARDREHQGSDSTEEESTTVM